MQNFQIKDMNEIIALIVSVLIGTGAYLGFVILKKNQKASFKMIWILVINLFVTYLVSEALKIFKWGEYRTLILPPVAYAGQYLTDWFDKRYPKIFDSGVNKMGLDLDNNNVEENDDTEKIENKEQDGD